MKEDGGFQNDGIDVLGRMAGTLRGREEGEGGNEDERRI